MSVKTNSMAIETLPSVKNPTMFTEEDAEEDALFNEDFRLYLSDEEGDKEEAEEKQSKVVNRTPPKASPTQTEDEILNKFDVADAAPAATQPDDNLEGKLLNGVAGDTESEEGLDKASEASDSSKPSTDKDAGESKVLDSEDTSSKDGSVSGGDGAAALADNVSKPRGRRGRKRKARRFKVSAEIIAGKEEEQEVTKDDKEVEEDKKEGDTKEDDDKEEDDDKKEKDDDKKEEDDDKKEEDAKPSDDAKEDEDGILKNQIMDTEDLLQIAEKQTDDADKDISNENSPQSAGDKGESEDAENEGDDTETDKMDIDDPEVERMDEDDDYSKRQHMSSSEDCVDIDENNFSKEVSAEIDKVYESIIASEGSDETKAKVDEDNSSSSQSAEKTDDVSKEQKVIDKKPGDNQTEDPSNVDEQLLKEKTTEADLTTSTETSGIKSVKRTLAKPDDSPTNSKKQKLQDNSDTVAALDASAEPDQAKEVNGDSDEPEPVIEFGCLNSIDEYMKLKSLKKLTFRDLEQIVMLKICECIGHKNEIGEVRHKLGVMEQMADMWRKETAQLSKQCRDLEIVHKRVLHEVRAWNDRTSNKPLIPVKITRSVGLQVRSDNRVINNIIQPKRRINRPQTNHQVVTTPISKQNKFNNNINNNNRTNTTPNSKTPPNKTLSTTPKLAPANKIVTPIIASSTTSSQKVVSPKSNSLLSKALQNSTTAATTITPVTSTNSIPTITIPAITSPIVASTLTPVIPPTSNKTPPVKSSSNSGVIDLTDEDDKKPSNTSQGVRIVSTPVKTAAVVTTASVVNPPRIMYVYNNQLHQGVLATDPTKPGSQKLMFKFNSNVISSANSVIATVSNSPITVTNGGVRSTNQTQSVKVSTPVNSVRAATVTAKVVSKHPAPLPLPPPNQANITARKPVPPKPHLTIKRSNGGLILSWKMPYNLDNYEAIVSYQLYAYQETSAPPSSEMWRKVGDVKALALPMACTLTQFADGNKYHFAVRAVDVQKRMGPFSDPEQILL